MLRLNLSYVNDSVHRYLLTDSLYAFQDREIDLTQFAVIIYLEFTVSTSCISLAFWAYLIVLGLTATNVAGALDILRRLLLRYAGNHACAYEGIPGVTPSLAPIVLTTVATEAETLTTPWTLPSALPTGRRSFTGVCRIHAITFGA